MPFCSHDIELFFQMFFSCVRQSSGTDVISHHRTNFCIFIVWCPSTVLWNHQIECRSSRNCLKFLLPCRMSSISQCGTLKKNWNLFPRWLIFHRKTALTCYVPTIKTLISKLTWMPSSWTISIGNGVLRWKWLGLHIVKCSLICR